MHLPSGTKRVITLPAIAMVFALLATPVHAQHVVTTNEMYPITGPYDYTPTVPCGCSGPSDAVNLRGVIHMMVQANGEVFINADGTQNPTLSFFTFGAL